jgi:NAD-reducing hydrogenase large subunit
VTRTITLAPVSRLEGHGKVTIHLDDRGEVQESRFHVVELRGFEKFCEGRLMSDMPVITSRICGICPVSHHLASAKACDDAWGVDIPPSAKKLRELMHMGQFIHSHALHFFYLAAPDFVLGPDSDPALRNVVGVIGADPELGKKAIRLRQIGQGLIAHVGGRPIHPVTAIPGGMARPLSHDERFAARREIEEALPLARLGLTLAKSLLERHGELVARMEPLATRYMGLVKDDALELYDGKLRLIDAGGDISEELDPRRYLDHLGEHVEDWSYMKFPFSKKAGFPEGTYRVGPLARLNVARRIDTPIAGQELRAFKELATGAPVHQTLHYHTARLIELVYAVERARELLADDEVVASDVRVKVERKSGMGVGVVEAPRGSLIHHYWVDDDGRIVKVNIIVSTAHNNAAINRSVDQAAREFVRGGEIREGALNRIEMAIRCYDPCLSCATHAWGQMPLVLEVRAPDGSLVASARNPDQESSVG